MGIYQSKGKIPEEVYRFWSAVASSIRLGWLGTDDMAKVGVFSQQTKVR